MEVVAAVITMVSQVELAVLEVVVGQAVELGELQHRGKEIMVVKEELLVEEVAAAVLAESPQMVQAQEVTVAQDYQIQFLEQPYIMQEEQAALQEDMEIMVSALFLVEAETPLRLPVEMV
jgi:hypothetical protein